MFFHFGENSMQFSATVIQEREKNKQQSRDHEETKRQIEEDADEEILKLMQTHEQALIECKEENVNLRNKSTTFQRKVCLIIFD